MKLKGKKAKALLGGGLILLIGYCAPKTKEGQSVCLSGTRLGLSKVAWRARYPDQGRSCRRRNHRARPPKLFARLRLAQRRGQKLTTAWTPTQLKSYATAS